MVILKKQTFGSVATVLAFVLALAGLITYHVNVGGAGYFQGAAVHQANTLMILSMVALLAVVVLAQLELGKVADKVLDIVSGLLRIAAPAGCRCHAAHFRQSPGYRIHLFLQRRGSGRSPDRGKPVLCLLCHYQCGSAGPGCCRWCCRRLLHPEEEKRVSG